MARKIGEALIGITPDTLGFPAALRAKLKAALTGVKGEVPISADTVKLDAAIAASKAKIATLKHQLTGMNLDLATKEFTAKIAAARAEVRKLESETSRTKLDMDSTAAIAKIAALKAQQVHLATAMSKMKADVDIRAASTKILALNAEVVHLESVAKELELSANSGKVDAALTAARAKVAVLQSAMRNMPVSANLNKFRAQLAVARVELDALTRARELQVKVNVDTSRLAKVGALIAGLFRGGGGGGGGGGGRGFGFGFLGFLTASIGGLKLWHVALSAALEALIAVGAASLAAAVGIAAMAPAAKDIATQLNAIDVVNASLGDQIPSLAGKFDALAQSLAPQVIEAFGGALNIVNKNTGALGETAHAVVTGIDNMIARLDLWANTQNQLGGVLHAGVGFLSQFASVLGHLLLAFDNLLKAAPGTAHFLLTMIDGFARVLDWVSKLPAPILAVAIAWHSTYIWGRLLLGVLGLMPGLIGKTARAMIGLGGPALAALAAVGLAAFAFSRAWNSSSRTVAASIAAIDNALSSMTTAEAFFALPAAIGAVNDKLKQVKSTGDVNSILAGWGQLHSQFINLNDIWQRSGDHLKAAWNDLKQVTQGSILHEVMALGNAFRDLANNPTANRNAALVQQKQDIDNLNAEINKLLGSSRNLDNETGVLIRRGFNFSQALSLMSLAGVQVNDKFALMQQKVQNLISGYEAISVRGAILTNSVDAITFAAGLQSTKVHDLNSAWDTFISTITGSESSFVTVEQNISGMFKAANSTGVKLTLTNGKVSTGFGDVNKAAAGAKASFSGLDSVSLGLQQTFGQSVTDANALLDALTSQAAAAGLDQKGTDLLAQATRDLVVQMAPAAKGSNTLTAELWALAQRGGISHKEFLGLASGVTKVKSPVQDLQGIIEKFTVASAGLTEDVKNLSVALGTTLNTAMAQAVFLASGGQKAFTDFAIAVLGSGNNINKMKPSAATLARQLVTMTGNVTDAKKEFLAFAQGALKLSTDKANALWNSVQGGGETVKRAGESIRKASAVIVAAFNRQKGAADVARLGVDLLTASVVQNGARSGATRAARQNLVSDMIRAGVNARTAKRDVDRYTAAVAQNGASSNQARAARQRLNDDLTRAALNSRNGRRDLATFTAAVENNGSKSNQAQSARNRLIADLERAGLSSRTAKTFVDRLQGSINAMHGKNVSVGVKGTGSGGVTIEGQHIAGAQLQQIFLRGMAGGGRVGGSGNQDTVHAMLTPGEVVVPKGMVAAGAVDHLRGRLPGFAAGGLVGYPDAAASAVGRDAALAMLADTKAAVAALKATAAKAAAGSPVAYSRVAGVTQWEPDVARVLGMLGLPLSDLPTVMSQIQSESGGNPNAINLSDINAQRGDPSKGLLQLISGTFAAYRNPALSANIYDPMANIYAGINYAVHRYGNPGWLGVLGHGHGYAAGGLVGSLAAGQAAERGSFAVVRSTLNTALAHPNAYVSSHKTSLRGELATLTRRQAAEQGAYAALSGKGLTSGNLSKFGTRLRSESTTAHDKFLSTAVPGPVRALVAALAALKATAAAGQAPGGTGGTGPGAVTTARLGQQEKAEQGDFSAVATALAAAFAHPSAFVSSHRVSLAGEMATLTRRQATQEGAYRALAGKGLTKSNLSKFSSASRAEATTARDKFLSTAVPGQARALAAALQALSASAGGGVTPSQGGGGGGGGSKGGGGGGSGHPNILSKAQYTADLRAVHGRTITEIRKDPHLTHLWHLLHLQHLQHLADIGMSQGGQVMDRGGWLPAGPSMVWNQTGRAEHLTPDSGAQNVTVEVHFHGPVGSQQELQRWLLESVRELARVKGGGSVQRAFDRR